MVESLWICCSYGRRRSTRPSTHAFDGFIQGIDVGELLAQQETMVGLQLPLESLGEQVAFGTHPASSQFS
jgi:hypothetical protein